MQRLGVYSQKAHMLGMIRVFTVRPAYSCGKGGPEVTTRGRQRLQLVAHLTAGPVAELPLPHSAWVDAVSQHQTCTKEVCT